MLSGLVEHLRAFGDRPALMTESESISYRELAESVDAVAARLGSARRLAVVVGGNTVATVAGYLGALQAGCVVMPVAEFSAELDEVYSPDIVIRETGIEVRRAAGMQVLHRDLALLMSTSGSTGSPKFVRLSYSAVLANAEAIADYLDITENDRAATTLPMHYCYGLSVVHSYLLRGAGLILTDHSVVDDGFWELFQRWQGTSFAAVPYTIDLLDQVGFAEMQLPHLRYVTQAGGRLAPERVRAYAELAERGGWDFVVMYGQTEATARMAYLPAHLAASHPDSIGIAIPGGSFTLRQVEDAEPGVGELVYRGPNVMMGYAYRAADLARGHTVTELRTGDLARWDESGLFRIVGRRNRFAKAFGLRIDLQRVESTLAAAGMSAWCADGDGSVIVAVEGATDLATVSKTAAQATGLPRSAVHVHAVDALPRLASGKPDYPAVARLGHARRAEAQADRDIRGLYAEVLHIDRSAVHDAATFSGLGGDSLSYVTLAVRLERILGALPAQWHMRTISELEGLTAYRRRRWGRSLDTSIVLRTLSILFIVGSHIGLFVMWSGAHVLLGIAGFNFARFSLAQARGDRLRHIRSTVALIAIPTIAWVAFTMVVQHGYYGWTNLLLLNKILGPSTSPTAGHLWFVEVLVYFLLGSALLLRIPAVDRAARRAPFWFAVGLFAVASIVRFHSFGLYPGDDGSAYSPLTYWFFALGMMAATASTVRHRIVTTLALAATVPGYFHDTHRELLITGGLALLIWLPTVRVPAVLAGMAVVIADSSLFLYLTHWQIYPLFHQHTVVAWVACIVVGIAAAKAWSVLRRVAAQMPRRRRTPAEPVVLRRRVAPLVRRLPIREAA